MNYPTKRARGVGPLVLGHTAGGRGACICIRAFGLGACSLRLPANIRADRTRGGRKH